MPGRLYGYPVLGRFGLCHNLPAWARCIVWAKSVGAQILAPRWLQLRLGPYLRRERDKRDYFRHFSNAGYIGGLRKSVILATSARRDAGVEMPAGEWTGSRDCVMQFRNLLSGNDTTYFPLFVNQPDLLREELLRITRPQFRPAPFPRPTLAIHVRMGDFSSASPDALARGATNTRIPIDWYVDALIKMRRSLGSALDTIVFSDGSDADLAPLLGLPDVGRAPRQPAVTDLHSMAQADVLIASGSAFSLWARFLGQAPTICHPGQIRLNVNRDGLEVESNPGRDLPDAFMRSVEARLAGSASRSTHP